MLPLLWWLVCCVLLVLVSLSGGGVGSFGGFWGWIVAGLGIRWLLALLAIGGVAMLVRSGGSLGCGRWRLGTTRIHVFGCLTGKNYLWPIQKYVDKPLDSWK